MSSTNDVDGVYGSDGRRCVQAESRGENQSLESAPRQINQSEQERASMMMSPGYQVCKRLIRELEPEYRRRYLSEPSSPETKKQTKLVQHLILSMVRQGPVRECIEERAAKRSDLDPHDEVRLDVDVNMPLEEQESNATESSPALRISSSSRRAKWDGVSHEVCDLFAIANDDDSFAFICLLFDEDLESTFKTIAGPYMDTYRKCNSLHLTDIMQDVLEHAQWKCFGGQNANEHQNREAALLHISEIVQRARAAYGLAPYSSVRCRFKNCT